MDPIDWKRGRQRRGGGFSRISGFQVSFWTINTKVFPEAKDTDPLDTNPTVWIKNDCCLELQPEL